MACMCSDLVSVQCTIYPGELFLTWLVAKLGLGLLLVGAGVPCSGLAMPPPLPFLFQPLSAVAETSTKVFGLGHGPY